jgi:hypothetical protein
MSLPLPVLSDLLSLQIDEQQQAEADAGESDDEVEGLGAKEGRQGRHVHQQQQLQHRGQLEHQGGQPLGHQVHPQDLQAAAATAQLQAVGTIAREALGCPFAAEPIRAAVQLRDSLNKDTFRETYSLHPSTADYSSLHQITSDYFVITFRYSFITSYYKFIKLNTSYYSLV